MSIFKITLKPVVKSRKWSISSVKSGRKEKTCEICQKTIKIGEPAISYLKRNSIGLKQEFKVRYCCINCNNELAKKINDEELEQNTNSPTDSE